MRLHQFKWVLAAGLVAGGIKAYCSRAQLELWVQNHRFTVAGLERALPSEVYPISSNRWLEFSIPKGTPLARIISNASISRNQKAEPRMQWPYALEYELRGAQGAVTSRGVYHFRAEQLVFADKASSEPVEVNTFLERGLSPLSGRYWMLNLTAPGTRNSETLRLRLHSSHPDLLEVALRIYFRTDVPERKVAYLWNRLSIDQKRDLARGTVYTYEGLTDEEKFCVLRYHWSVAAPEGVPVRDFQRRILYVRDDSENFRTVKNWVPAGIIADAAHWGVLPLTNFQGSCRLELTDYGSGPTAAAVTNTLVWHPELQERLQTNEVTWFGTNQSLLLTNRNVLLRFCSSTRVYGRVFVKDSGDENELTPEPVHVLTFTCSPTNDVDYAVEHAGSEPTLFKVELRRLTPESTGPGPGSVRYELLTGNGESFQGGDVVLTNTFSPYDWLVAADGPTNATVAQSLCFIVPPQVERLRIGSKGQVVLVNAYSRPYRLVKKTCAPDDYSASHALTPRQPSWFTVRPPDHVQRREAGQSAIVLLQPPLPENDPLIQAGQYEWDSFLPETAPVGQMVMYALKGDQPARAESLPFTYFPLTVGSQQTVRIQGLPWEQRVSPMLILALTEGTPAPVVVTIDGAPVFTNRLEAPVSALRLGELKTGEHELNIQALTPAAAFMNFQDTTASATHVQRFCLLASSNALSFPYVKREAGAEILVLRIFSRSDSSWQPFHVRFALKALPARGVGPFPDLTLPAREAEVTPGPPGRSCLVGTAPAQLDDGVPLFFPMGPDLPPGTYEIEVRVEAPTPRWLSLSRTTPGLTEKLSVTLQHLSY